MGVRDALDGLRNPRYTGSNRCVPCTLVNGVLAGALALGIAVVLGREVGWGAGALGGAVALLVGGGSIYLRGYLVPGTPRLTKRYFPDRVLRWFDKAEPRPAGEGVEGSDIDVEAALLDAGAVEACEHEDDLCLTGEFRTAWDEVIAGVRADDASRAELARLIGVDPDRVAFDEYEEAFVARVDDVGMGQWESRAAFLADVAAATVLRERFDGWADLDVRRRSRLLRGLRIFLERCPACDGAVAVEEGTVESCCRSVDVVAASCRDCGARLFEMERPDAERV